MLSPETEAYIEDHGSTRASVLVVPFTGDPDLFELDPRPLRSRSGPGYMPGPFGSVTEDGLHLEAHEYAGTIAGRPSGRGRRRNEHGENPSDQSDRDAVTGRAGVTPVGRPDHPRSQNPGSPRLASRAYA